MFGVNYRYELNEAKKTIKLRPTAGTIIAASVIGVLSWAPLVFILASEKHESKKTTNTEDHFPVTD